MVLERYQTILLTLLFSVYLLVDLPISIHQFVYFKWFLNGLLAISGLVWFIYEKDIQLPKLSIVFWSIFCILILFKFGQALSSSISPISSTTLDKMTFIPLFLVGYNLFLKGKIKLDDILLGIFASTFIFLILTIVSIIQGVNFDWVNRNNLAGNFGNINIAAEFLGISLVLQLSKIIRSQLNKQVTIFLYGLSILTSLYLYFASSRSVFIAVGTAICTLLCFKSCSKKQFFKWFGITAITFFLLAGLGSLLKADAGINQTAWIPDLQKSVSTNTRYELIKATLQMIQEHPWGVGAGEFEFAIMPYLHKMMPEFNENVIPHAPHNEYLRLIAEEGIPFTLIFLGLIVAFLYERRQSVFSTLNEYPIVGSFFMFWLIQSAFQFPFTNGLSFLVFCIMLAFALSKICPISKNQAGIKIPFASTIGYAGVYSCLLAFVFTSEYLTLWHASVPEKTRLAYTLNSRNWYAGMFHAQSLIDRQHYESAQNILNAELKKRPHNFVALRNLIQINILRNNVKEACHLMKQYDTYFGGNSSYRSFRLASCPTVISAQ